MSERILLVEDERDLAMIVSDTLRDLGYGVVVAHDGAAGLEMFGEGSFDIVVADIMMPRLDGFEMARRIRRISPSVPLLFLTARSGIDDIETGFEIGANDYLKKPFELRELVIRIKALLRRREGGAGAVGEEVYEIGSYRFDRVAQTLTAGSKSRELSHIEAILLGVLASKIGKTVTASELMTAVWQRDDIYNRNSLHGFIHKLRRALGGDPRIAIINQRGVGYMLVVR